MKMQISLAVVLLSGLPLSQVMPGPTSDQPVDFLQRAAVRALNFEQGDSASLNKSQHDFTPEGWNEFLKHMRGFLDAKGAPTFNSKFVPVKNTVIVSKDNGSIHLKIPGILTQTQGGSRTTYRLRIEVRAAGKPLRIEHLEQVTCSKESAANYCM